MIFRKSSLLTAGLALCIALFVNDNAHAAGVEVSVSLSQQNALGDGASSYLLFLNGSPLAAGPQVVSLSLGDVLRAEVSASAATDTQSGTASHDQDVKFDIRLADVFDGAVIQTTLNATANSAPDTAQGFAGSTIDCFFTSTGCSAPGLPGSISFNSGVQSSTLSIAPNAIMVNNVTTETGNVGGPESLVDLVTTLDLDRSGGDPVASTNLRAVALAIFNASTSGSGSLELTVTEVRGGVVPVPAAAWLFGSALGLLGWLRTRKAR